MNWEAPFTWFFGSALGIIGFIITLALYFLPTIVAAVRHHRNVVGILLLNFFLGWSFIGWVAALIWAVLK